MSETKHTPGPWEVEFDDSDHSEGHIIRMGEAIDSPGYHKTHHRIQYDHMLYPGDKGFGEAHANARLISAAPDMLAALRAMEEAFVVDREKFTESQAAAVLQMDAAVAKATGGQHDPDLLALEA
jgi:hypothetical protein